MTAATVAPKQRRPIPGFAQLQRIGRSLMLPIAALPAAGLLLRFGQADMLGKDGLGHTLTWLQPVADVLAAAGNALFSNLPIIFAIGVAIGFAKKSEGATAMAGLVGYLVFQNVSNSLAPRVMPGVEDPTVNYGVLGGIVMGVVAAVLYDKFYRTKLPTYLAFFGGRRFVPIITALVALGIGVVAALIYPWFNDGFNAVGEWVTNPSQTVVGGFVYGTLNRLLVPFGLHHLLNSFPWFTFGSYTDASGAVWQGDIARFIHGDPTAGAFMTGFFPIMMFALPAAALAIWRVAKPGRREVVGGIMISAALTAFLTGITEPLEFSFLYVALPLYIVHAVLTGTSMALVNGLGLHDGFNFSAGFTDFALNFNLSAQAGIGGGGKTYLAPLLIVLIGLVYGVIYYALFYFGIKIFNFKTPGREDDGAEVGDAAASIVDEAQMAGQSPGKK